MKSCREIKTLFTQMREWASKALGFAKLLRKDLEIATEFKVKVVPELLMDMLQATHHVKVRSTFRLLAIFYDSLHSEENKSLVRRVVRQVVLYFSQAWL